MTAQAANNAEVTVEELARRMAEKAPLVLLDVRNRADFAAWRIEGRTPVPILNVPYFEMLEAGGKDDVVESVAAYTESELRAQLPAGRPVVAICAKGQTSAHVVEGLRRHGYDAASLRGGMAAWAALHTVTPVVDEPGLRIDQIVRPARGCVSYVVASDGRAALIDPLRHVETYHELARARGLRYDVVLDTHGHADHVSGGAAIARELSVPYRLHPYDAIHPIDMLPAQTAIDFLRDGEELCVGRARIRVIHAPGHTLGNLALHVNDRFLLSGDTIFVRSISRPDLGGHGEAWAALHYRSLRRLSALPDDTIVLPGHFGAPSEADDRGLFAARLDDLRRTNDGLRMALGDEAEFVRYVLANLPEFPARYVEMKRVNLGLVRPGQHETEELELGRNVCALGNSGTA